MAVWLMMKTNLPARKIIATHTAVDELQLIYGHVLKTGDGLNIPTARSRTYRSSAPVLWVYKAGYS
jgi:hypothetical protein